LKYFTGKLYGSYYPQQVRIYLSFFAKRKVVMMYLTFSGSKLVIVAIKPAENSVKLTKMKNGLKIC
jgi:hypothetical protein